MRILDDMDGTPVGRRVFLGLAAFGVSGIVWGSKAAGLMERLLAPIAVKDGSGLVIGFAYRKELPLVSNVGLYIDFAANSAGQ